MYNSAVIGVHFKSIQQSVNSKVVSLAVFFNDYPRIWAVFAVTLVAVTWKLWFPMLDATGFPSVPLADEVLLGQRPMHGYALMFASAVLLVGLGIAMTSGRRFAWWIVAIGLGLSFLLDQHRLQPWAYQLAILAILFATTTGQTMRRWLIPFAASVYIYSAAGKFDYQFAHTVGQDFLRSIFAALGGLPESWNESTRAAMTMFFPTVELAAGIACLFRPTRVLAGIVLVGMHASLIAILGPWSLDHSPGVLVWNVALAFQAYWWMVRGWSDGKVQVVPSQNSNWSSLAIAVVIFAMAAPLVERRGLWDHWLSWSLYSPHTSRVEVQLHVSAADRMTPGQRSFLEPDDDGDGWQTLSIERWSLGGRGVPIYPQSRYQLALLRQLIRRQGLTDDVRIAIKSVADRRTGRRDVIYKTGSRQIE